MGKKIFRKTLAVTMSIAMAACLSNGLGYCDNVFGNNKPSLAAKTVQKSETNSLPEFKVQKATGQKAQLRDSKVADSDSEEIQDLVNGKHVMDETFDNTEYKTDINQAHKGKWAIYVYMCGSNLESDDGSATDDLSEMLDAKFSKNVNVVVETGGSKKWNNNMMSSKKLERYLINKKGIQKVGTAKKASMGKESTLTDFLKFCNKKYPAENQMVIFWNHGGGSLGGACYDELYNDDHLTLNEIDSAFNKSFGSKRIEAIGFDCCLMATLDTANICKNHAKMLVGSEETEPGNGWYYTDWLTALNKSPKMSNAKLGKSICTSYVKGCKKAQTQDEITLSAIDLNKINLVTDSVNLLSLELFSKAVEDSSTITKFGRAASKTENYGGNTDKSGYFDILDLGDFLNKSSANKYEASEYVKEALNKAVVYNINSKLRSKASGLALYYPYSKSLAAQQKYEAVAASDLYAGFQRLMLTGEMDDAYYNLMEKYWNKLYPDSSNEENPEKTTAPTNTDNPNLPDDDTEENEIFQLPTASDLTTVSSSNQYTNDGKYLPLEVTEDGYLSASIGAENMGAVESVLASYMYYVEEMDAYLCLGFDNDVAVDWDNGIVKDDFRGVWACLDGHFLYMDICYESDEYNLYNVPILLNGKEKELSVAYYYESNSYEIVGVSECVDTNAANQCATRDVTKLKKGDKITTLFDVYQNGEWSQVQLETFKYNTSMKIKEENLDEGEYALMFLVEDVAGNEVWSDYGYIEYKDGQINAYVD